MNLDPRLLPHQAKASKFALERLYSYSAIDMGLGKTFIGINWIKSKTKSTLVIAPLRTAQTSWPNEIKKWAPELSYEILHGPDKSLKYRARVYIINYEGLKWLYSELFKLYHAKKPIPFASIVLDEASMVKSYKTSRFKFLKDIRHLCTEGALMLGGTPTPNSLLDLWSQMFLLDRGKRLGSKYHDYRKKYFNPMTKWGTVNESNDWKELERSRWELADPKYENVIYEKVGDVMFRLDADDYIKLPSLTYNYIDIDLPKVALDYIQKLAKDKVLTIGPNTIMIENASKLSMCLRQICQGAIYVDEQKNWVEIHDAKVKALKSLIEEANGHGILCPIQFRFELEILQKAFPGTPYIAGGTKDFPSILAKWNRRELPLLLVHPASISHGVNAQAGSHIVVWYALTWSLEQYLQLNKRLHRMGQTHGVVIHHLVAKGTIDEFIVEALRTKKNTQDCFLSYLKQLHTEGA